MPAALVTVRHGKYLFTLETGKMICMMIERHNMEQVRESLTAQRVPSLLRILLQASSEDMGSRLLQDMIGCQ